MSGLSTLYGGGGLKPKFQIFTSSGTFTPSAALLAAGGVVTVHLYGAGGGGGGNSSVTPGYNGLGASGAGGGGAGQYIRKLLTLSAGGITVTLGAGGSGGSPGGYSMGSNGNNGGNSTFGNLITALGGKYGLAAGLSATVRSVGMGGAGSMQASSGLPPFEFSNAVYDGAGGVGGSAPNLGLGGTGGYPVSGASSNGGSGDIASGGGGAAADYEGLNQFAYGGTGGNGYCLVEWWE